MLSDQDVIQTLNNLIQVCRDGETGYKFASDHVEGERLKVFLSGMAQQRNAFAQELAGHVTRLQGTPSSSSTILGVLHRTWMNLKGRDTAGVLAECVRGEDIAAQQYARALDQDLPEAICRTVLSHFDAIKSAQKQLNAYQSALD